MKKKKLSGIWICFRRVQINILIRPGILLLLFLTSFLLNRSYLSYRMKNKKLLSAFLTNNRQLNRIMRFEIIFIFKLAYKFFPKIFFLLDLLNLTCFHIIATF